jgi:C4-dicarboxylate-specific signal transduction histidine kinase
MLRPRLVPGRHLRRGLFLVGGALLGIGYGRIDHAFDMRLVAGTLTGRLADVHGIVDGALPVVTGILLALVTFAWRDRSLLVNRQQRRARSLEARLQHIERDQAVWVMAASVLHEVRNPLHTLGLLFDDLAPLVETRGTEPAKLVERCRAHIARIAAQMDILRQLPSSIAPERTATNISELVQTVLEGRATDLHALGIKLIMPVSNDAVSVVGDPMYIRIVVDNLLDNSLHALSLRDGAHVLTIEVERSGHEVLLRIGDSGPGVPAANVEGLFAPFRSTKERGLGLGLPIAKALARAMDGDLLFDGTIDGHTFFSLRLPSTERP